MSHIITAKIENFLDLDTLEAAAEDVGMELVRDEHSFRSYQRNAICDHKLRVKGNPDAYELGIMKAQNGKPGFQALYDFWGGSGQALENCVGPNCEKLADAYNTRHSIAYWQQRGARVTKTVEADGEIVLTVTGMRVNR